MNFFMLWHFWKSDRIKRKGKNVFSHTRLEIKCLKSWQNIGYGLLESWFSKKHVCKGTMAPIYCIYPPFTKNSQLPLYPDKKPTVQYPTHHNATYFILVLKKISLPGKNFSNEDRVFLHLYFHNCSATFICSLIT